MASIKEIRTHIKSVEQTLKITNAMYLISSSNLRKARRQLTDVEPYFSKIEATISDILHHSPEIDHRFFDKRPGIPPDKRKTGFIVITGDKGLAGAYNHNILKLAEEKMSRAANPSLFVVGQVGRSYFLEHGIPIDHVVQHNHWNGKDCPKTIRATAGAWEAFLALCRGETANVSKLDTDVDTLANVGIIDQPDYWKAGNYSKDTVEALIGKTADYVREDD